MAKLGTTLESVPTSWARRTPRPAGSDTEGGGEILTKQAMKGDTDVNLIVATYGKTGQFANINPREPRYGDFSEVVDLVEAQRIVEQANAEFMALPAELRAMADNNPVIFLEMLADEGATAALVKAGLPLKTPKTPDAPADPVASGDGV